jgi:hypothetical protein
MTEAGIGKGKCSAIKSEINIITEKINACVKKPYTFLALISFTSLCLLTSLYKMKIDKKAFSN